MHNRRLRPALIASVSSLALLLAACGGANDLGGGSSDGGSKETGSQDKAEGSDDCKEFEQYGKFEGETVNIFSSIRDVEAELLDKSWEDFARCTGMKVVHNGVGEFESQIVVQVEGNNAPDLAFFPQPGLLARLAKDGHLKPAPEAVKKNTDEGWSPEWAEYATVDGTFYGAPLMASVKSFVWYSPSKFKEAGYEVPKTLDELTALTEKIAADNPDGKTRPWCAGIESGGATGWPLTDWVEDFVLRTAGPETYDKWVKHEIPFNDPKIAEALDKVGSYLKDDKFANGGIGDYRTIAATSFNEGGFPILDGECFMHRQASFYEVQWPEGTKVAPDGDVFAFYLPGKTTEEKPLLVAGEFVGAFNDRPATQALQTYLSSAHWANSRVSLGGVTSANKGVDPANASSDVLRLAIELLQDEKAVSRFDGSDIMPSEVGAGSFWKSMTQWIDGSRDTATALSDIEASWPKN